MWTLIGLLILLFGAGAFCFFVGDDDRIEFAGAVGMFVGGFFLILVSACAIEAKMDQKFINKNFGTDYTLEEMFWYGKDIKSMVIGEKWRIEKE